MHKSYVSISADDWVKVIENLSQKPDAKMYLFILRSLANAQKISYYSIAAFKGQVMGEQEHPGTANNTHIAQITKAIAALSDVETIRFDDVWWCIWNVNDKAWTIGWDSFNELNKAFKKVNV